MKTRALLECLGCAALIGLGLVAFSSRAAAQISKTQAGQFFTIVEPINDEAIERVRTSSLPAIDRATAKGARPTLVFEFRSGETRPGQSSFGASSDLATFLATRLTGARQTVAYVPEPLSGYVVLAVLACDEIIMGPDASLGPITPEGEPITPRERETVRELARLKPRDPDLLLGMLDPDADLRKVRTADRQFHYILADRLPEFEKQHQVIENQPAWEGGRRGILTVERARESFVRLVAEDRAKIAEAFNLPSTSDDPTLGGPVSPTLIRIEGVIDQIKESYLRRRIGQAFKEGDNLIIFDIDSEGGLDHPADTIAETIVNLKDIRTVAYINEHATGVATLIALACDEIVFHKGGRLGNLTQLVDGSKPDPLDDRMTAVLAKRASKLALANGHPGALARAMVDPHIEVLSARDAKTGAVVFVTEDDLQAEPGRYQVQDTMKSAGSALTVTAENARSLGLATKIVTNIDELKVALNLGSQPLRSNAPTWVDSLVTLLNTPLMSWLLLFVGMFMLILELKLPGVGLPAIISALAFLLFFWGHYLGGTADQLEILLFIVGLACLALELFIFPGFGVFGVSGILLILISVVMASHTFVWPTQEYEYRQMGRTLMQVTGTIVLVAAGAIVLGRYFPSLPLFNRMVLKPEPLGGPLDPLDKPLPDPDSPLFYLLGEVGHATTPLRPTGKARFGEQLVDVTADGLYIESGSVIEVVEIRGSLVVVKRV